jgi:hypothetical protein
MGHILMKVVINLYFRCAAYPPANVLQWKKNGSDFKDFLRLKVLLMAYDWHGELQRQKEP